MKLSEPMRRELLWLYANRSDLDEALFADRAAMYDGDPMDLGTRYANLAKLGYVDTVMRFFDGGIGYARLTEEGRFAAEEILKEDLESSPIPQSVKEAAGSALASGSVTAAASIVLKFLGLM